MALYGGPIVDAHHHLWDYSPGKLPWLDGEPALARDFRAADYFAAAGRLNIFATVWIEAVAADPLEEARAAARLPAQDPRLGAAVIAHAPLDAPDLPARLDALQAAAPALRGIRDIVAVRPGFPSLARHADLLQRPAFAEGLRELARRGLAFDLMLEPWQMPAALALARTLPSLPFIIEHGGSPDFTSPETAALWRHAMLPAAELPNVFVKLSALHCRMPGWSDGRLAPPIRMLVEALGVDRIAFASDFPVHDRTVPFERAFDTFRHAVADLSIHEQAALFYDTARRIYRI